MEKISQLSCISLDTLVVALLLSLLSFGCGGDDCESADCADGDIVTGSSGLDRNSLLSDLNDEQRLAACTWGMEKLLNAANDADCKGDGENVASPSDELLSGCVADDHSFPTCGVDKWEDCAVAISADICNSEAPVACNEYIQCRNQSSPPPNESCGSILFCNNKFDPY